MSLYYEAADLLTNAKGEGGSLKSRVYNSNGLKNKPAQVYALASEATKWSPVLKGVIENSRILREEKKVRSLHHPGNAQLTHVQLTAVLALLLAHDLLLSKKGIAAPSNHILRLAITRHKTRLNAEFTKARLKLGFGDIDALLAHIEGKDSVTGDMRNGTSTCRYPRWVRINTLQTSLEEQLSCSFTEYAAKDTLAEVTSASSSDKVLHVDEHVPNLIALPPGSDLSKKSGYQEGHLILQDKASCFPAVLLDPQSLDGHVIDATAAPGNKTTHLAALLKGQREWNGSEMSLDRYVYAYERDKARTQVLRKMVTTAEATETVHCHNQDFLTVDPKSDAVRDVKALLLDPSCSGSGIIGRDDAPVVGRPVQDSSAQAPRSSRKRKRKQEPPPPIVTAESSELQTEQTPLELDNEPSSPLQTRLQSLANFQLKTITHAMRFPSARRITYSTCSIHSEENEAVVLRALNSKLARELGWRILTRHEQVDGLRRWHHRGSHLACVKIAKELKTSKLTETDPERLTPYAIQHVAEACIRCEKGTTDGTMGFFVAGFVRDLHDEEIEAALQRRVSTVTHEMSDVVISDEADEEEWEGFSD